MHRMTSSLRTVPLADTLATAKSMAAGLGIVRVTDTTWLDCMGIPVFASIRPDAAPRSLCVNAGKGVHPEEARVGAYMEAIEFTLAEYRNRVIEMVISTPRQVIAQEHADFEFTDLCPILGRAVDPDGPLACVEAEDLTSGQRLMVPAELAFSPFPENPAQRIFGTSTNGLASGNTVAEATLHGLCEVIERDIRSFNYFRDRSQLVHLDHPVSDVDLLTAKVEAAGLEWALRYTPNEFGLPYLEGFILEASDDAPIAISQGAGLHLVKDIAAVRGLAEAAQSRLSYIHGGRDDLIERFEYFARFDGEVERRATSQTRARITDTCETVTYSAIADMSGSATGMPQALDALLQVLGHNGIHQVLRVVLSSPDSPLAVVKVIVPKLEHFQPTLRRVGPRLVKFADIEGAT